MNVEKIRTAVFPVAGLGTRFLPASKATPKELLPVIDVPLIQYAIDEARDAGIERMIFVVHPAKTAIKRYVMDDSALRKDLVRRGKSELANQLQKMAFCPLQDDVFFAVQDEALGLGHAVLCASEYILPGPFAVILPDDLILGKNCIGEMIAAYTASDVGHIVATMEVAASETKNYGILDVVEQKGEMVYANTVVEKPLASAAPSREAVVGRYILHPSIIHALDNQAPGANGEIQLTDAIARSSGEVGLAGLRFSGDRFDCGSQDGMLRATLHLASRNVKYRSILAKFISNYPTKDILL